MRAMLDQLMGKVGPADRLELAASSNPHRPCVRGQAPCCGGQPQPAWPPPACKPTPAAQHTALPAGP